MKYIIYQKANIQNLNCPLSLVTVPSEYCQVGLAKQETKPCIVQYKMKSNKIRPHHDSGTALSLYLSLSVYISLSLFLSISLSFLISLSLSLFLSLSLSFFLSFSISLVVDTGLPKNPLDPLCNIPEYFSVTLRIKLCHNSFS